MCTIHVLGPLPRPPWNTPGSLDWTFRLGEGCLHGALHISASTQGGRRLPAVVALKKWGTSEGRQHPLQCERQHRQKLLAVEVAEAEPARALPPALGSPGFVCMAPAGSLANAHVPSWWPYSEVLESSGSRA